MAVKMAMMQEETLDALRAAMVLGAAACFVEEVEGAEAQDWMRTQRQTIEVFYINREGASKHIGWV